MEYAFRKCTNLKSITINGKVVFTPIAFEQCYSLSSIHISENNSKYVFEDDILYFKNNYEDDFTVIMSLDSKTERILKESVTRIGENAFNNNKKLKKNSSS